MLNLLSFVLFFIFFLLFNLYIATILIGFLYLFYFILNKIIFKKTNMKFIILSFFLIFLGLFSLYMNNDIFIKLKTSFVYWFFFAIFILSNVSKKLFKNKINLDKRYSILLKLDFAILFLILGFLNLYITINFETKIWFFFKIFVFPFIIFFYALIRLYKIF